MCLMCGLLKCIIIILDIGYCSSSSSSSSIITNHFNKSKLLLFFLGEHIYM